MDAGPLKNARLLEPLGFLNIQLVYVLGMGARIGFKLLRSQDASGDIPFRVEWRTTREAG